MARFLSVVALSVVMGIFSVGTMFLLYFHSTETREDVKILITDWRDESQEDIRELNERINLASSKDEERNRSTNELKSQVTELRGQVTNLVSLLNNANSQRIEQESLISEIEWSRVNQHWWERYPEFAESYQGTPLASDNVMRRETAMWAQRQFNAQMSRHEDQARQGYYSTWSDMKWGLIPLLDYVIDSVPDGLIQLSAADYSLQRLEKYVAGNRRRDDLSLFYVEDVRGELEYWRTAPPGFEFRPREL